MVQIGHCLGGYQNYHHTPGAKPEYNELDKQQTLCCSHFQVFLFIFRSSSIPLMRRPSHISCLLHSSKKVTLSNGWAKAKQQPIAISITQPHMYILVPLLLGVRTSITETDSIFLFCPLVGT